MLSFNPSAAKFARISVDAIDFLTDKSDVEIPNEFFVETFQQYYKNPDFVIKIVARNKTLETADKFSSTIDSCLILYLCWCIKLYILILGYQINQQGSDNEIELEVTNFVAIIMNIVVLYCIFRN